jgi:hypothetical protein
MSKEHLIPFKKGQSGNPKGRPKKYVLSLKTEGYKMTEINDTIQAMVGMNIDELKKTLENDKATILEKTVAAALRKGLLKGDLNNIETLMNRVYGKPKEKVDITTNGNNINEPRYTINIIKTNVDDQGDKDNESISRPS